MDKYYSNWIMKNKLELEKERNGRNTPSMRNNVTVEESTWLPPELLSFSIGQNYSWPCRHPYGKYTSKSFFQVNAAILVNSCQ